MNTVHLFAGIDVSKAALDAFEPSLGARRFENSPNGVAQLLAWLGPNPATAGLEATGAHHELAAQALASAGHVVHVYNPRQIRNLAQGLGVLAKTDRVDARVIAQCLRLVESPYALRSELAKELRDISRHIQYLTRARSDFKKKLARPGLSASVLGSIQRSIETMSAEILVLESLWLSLMRQSELHSSRYDNLNTIPRIGPKSARVLVSELPENLGGTGRKQLAAYFGLVPYDRQSGNSKRRSRLMYGNAHLRQPLFTAATMAMYRDPECIAFAQTLRAKGKHHLTIVCAVMHKLARRAIAVLLRNSPWRDLETSTT
jgi:transposase